MFLLEARFMRQAFDSSWYGLCEAAFGDCAFVLFLGESLPMQSSCLSIHLKVYAEDFNYS
jgi:hypothetical protein